MLKNKENITGYILAGGRSSRMGEDKGLILLNRKPIISYVINQLKPAVDKIIIVSNNIDYAQFGYEVITDTIKNIGPSAGILAALNHTDTEKNLIVSCDMPFITTDTIECIINKSNDYQIAVPIYKDKYEPMFAVYSKECIGKWEDLIMHGTYKMIDIINHFGVLKLNVDNNQEFNDSIFININTKDDYQKALDKLVDNSG